MVQWVSVLAALIGAGLLLAGVAVPGVQLLLTGLIILVAVRYESWRERAPPPVAGSDWHFTGERFEDPGTGTTEHDGAAPVPQESRTRDESLSRMALRHSPAASASRPPPARPIAS